MNAKRVLKVMLIVVLIAGLIAGVAYARESRGRRIREMLQFKEWQHKEWRGYSKWGDGRTMRGMSVDRMNAKRAKEVIIVEFWIIYFCCLV